MRSLIQFLAVAACTGILFSGFAHAQMLTGFYEDTAKPPAPAVIKLSRPAAPVEEAPAVQPDAGFEETAPGVFVAMDVPPPAPSSPEFERIPLLEEESAPVVAEEVVAAAEPVPTAPASAPEPEPEMPLPVSATAEGQPVNMTADSLRHDDTGNVITATGRVELEQSKRILKADEVSYDMNTDTVTASGNVMLTEPNGDVHFADSVVLSDEMKDGIVRDLKSYMTDGGRFVAEEGEKTGNTIVMKNAAYTPCNCEEDEEGNPGWQIKADQVIYEEDKNRVSYRNAQFEVFGMPVAWTPYLAHSDGKIKRKSGFLTPSAGFDSRLGAMVTSSYYWSIAPDRDATAGVMLSSKEAPVALGEYRQRFEEAELWLSGSATKSQRTDSVAGEEVKQDDEARGHLFAEGLWDINDKWRAGLDLELTSDDQYLRQYDFSSEDVLENEIYAERFSGRNYGVGRVLAFQDVRVNEEERVDQPNVLPEVSVNLLGDANEMLGGRWSLDMSMLGLQRDGSGQDMNRIIAAAGWQRRHIADAGVVSTLDLGMRGDAYYVSDRDIAGGGTGLSRDGSQTRYLPHANLVSSYPLARPYETMQAVIEPVVGLTLAPHVDTDDGDIPNEDSQDVQLDASNLLEPNRFPGFDRFEDGSHATYGLRTGLYGYGGSYADFFLGQSYRFSEDDNPFPTGSGLSRQESDIVGQLAGLYDDRYGLNYRFQIDSSRLSSQRHELDGFAKWGRFDISTRYLFAKALEGTDIDESREQISNLLGYKITRNWRIRTGATQDLGEDPGLRQARFGIDYFGCCVSFAVTAVRSLTSETSGDSGTEVMFRLGLKGLGEFQSAGSNGYGAQNYADDEE